jgi:hypothetical protein
VYGAMTFRYDAWTRSDRRSCSVGRPHGGLEMLEEHAQGGGCWEV